MGARPAARAARAAPPPGLSGGGAVRKTKIVATIGPGSGSHEMVRALAEAGMDAVRLNFSHGTLEEHAERTGIARAVQAELGRPLALIADLQGPKLRVGDLPVPRALAEGESVSLAGRERAREGDLVVSPSAIAEVLLPGGPFVMGTSIDNFSIGDHSIGEPLNTRRVLSRNVFLVAVPGTLAAVGPESLDDLFINIREIEAFGFQPPTKMNG